MNLLSLSRNAYEIIKGGQDEPAFLSWRRLSDYAPKKVMGLGENALEMFDGD